VGSFVKSPAVTSFARQGASRLIVEYLFAPILAWYPAGGRVERVHSAGGQGRRQRQQRNPFYLAFARRRPGDRGRRRRLEDVDRVLGFAGHAGRPGRSASGVRRSPDPSQ